MQELINRSHESGFKIGSKDLDIIKTFDGSRDYSIINNNKGEATIYSNISVVDATLASAALPLVLQDVQINGRRFADGGQLNNMPYDIIGKGEDALVLGFADGNMEKAVHSGSQEKIFSKGIGRRTIEAILRFIGLCIKKDNGLIKNRDFENIREKKPLTTIMNEVQGVSTTDFGRAYREKDERFLRGYLSTMNHLILYNYHLEAQLQIQDFRLQLKGEDSPNPIELKNKAKEFQKFTDNFEIRKSLFNAIDNYKKIDRKSEWYKSMIEYCLNDRNFTGEPKTVFENVKKNFAGCSTKEQKEIYGIVLETNKHLVKVKAITAFSHNRHLSLS